MTVPAGTRDVLIVGGGSTGLLLACLLAARGIDALVLERRAGPGMRSRAIGIHAAALAILDEVGVGSQLRAEAATVRRGIATCRGRRLGGLDFGDAPVRTLPQHRTEALLAARLEELRPGALQRGEAVTGVRTLEECVEVRTATATGRPGRRHARYVIGADGVHSAVRAWIGAEWRAHGRASHYAMADEGAVPTPSSTALLHLEPDGVVECFPLPIAGRRWVIRLRRPDPELRRDEFVRLVTQRLGFGPAAADLGAPAGFTAAQHLARPFSRGRIALLGDAAHELSPIGGQGMNLGWLDAAALAAALGAALKSGAPDSPFARYERRRTAALRAIRRAAFNTRLGAPIGGPGLPLRNALVRLLASRPLAPLARAVVTIRR